MATTTADHFHVIDADDFPERASPVTQYEYVLRYAGHSSARVAAFPWFLVVTDTGITFATHRRGEGAANGSATLIAIGAAIATLQVVMRRFGRSADMRLFPDDTRPDTVAHLAFGEPRTPCIEERLAFNALTSSAVRVEVDQQRQLPQGFLHAAPLLVARDGAWIASLASANDRMRARDCMRQWTQSGSAADKSAGALFFRDELVGPLDVPAPGLFLLGTKDHSPASVVGLGGALQDLVTLLRLHEVRARIVGVDDPLGEQLADALALPRSPQFIIIGAYEAPRM